MASNVMLIQVGSASSFPPTNLLWKAKQLSNVKLASRPMPIAPRDVKRKLIKPLRPLQLRAMSTSTQRATTEQYIS